VQPVPTEYYLRTEYTEHAEDAEDAGHLEREDEGWAVELVQRQEVMDGG
jgi:hypothetical protein